MSFNNSGVLEDAVAVTPSDSADNYFMGFYVGGAGNVALVTGRGTSVTLVGLAAGQFVPLAVRKINATNTTATNIVGFR